MNSKKQLTKQEQEDLFACENSFKNYALKSFDIENSEEKEHYVVLIKDKRITVSNGKSIWKRPQDALLALRNHLSTAVPSPNENIAKYGDIYKLCMERWINLNCEIISVTEYYNRIYQTINRKEEIEDE